MNDMKKWVFTIGCLDKRYSLRKVKLETGLHHSISGFYRDLLDQFNKKRGLVDFIEFVLRTIAEIPDPDLDPDEDEEYGLLRLVWKHLPCDYSFKLFIEEVNEFIEFLTSYLHITEEDAKLLIELRLHSVKFFGDYVEIITKLNDEVLEHEHA